MRIKPEFDQAGIVLLGSFNPAIFRPEWFARNEMIGEKESETPVILQTQQELIFEASRFNLHVSLERFAISDLSNHPEHIKDLVISCFGKFLPHTPIHSMGINRCIHFDAGSYEARNRAGSQLAPKTAWGKWGEKIEEGSRKSEDRNKHGGVISISMVQRDLEFEGCGVHVNAKVEPSTKNRESGIFVDVNNHFDLATDQVREMSSATAIRVLEANWEISLERAASIFDQIMKLTEGSEK